MVHRLTKAIPEKREISTGLFGKQGLTLNMDFLIQSFGEKSEYKIPQAVGM